MATQPAGNLTPQFYDWTAPYGGKPYVPDPSASAGKAIGGNLANLDPLFGLGQAMNAFQQSQLMGNLEAGIPGYSDLTAQSAQNIGANLRGELPQDVINQIIQQAAERGIGTGMGSSPASTSALLRSLGLTSIGQQQLGEQQLTGAVGRNPMATPFDLTKFQPGFEDVQGAQYPANVIGSAPSPAAAAQAAKQAALGPANPGAGIPQYGSGIAMFRQSPSVSIAAGGIGGRGPSQVMNQPVGEMFPGPYFGTLPEGTQYLGLRS